MIIFTAPGNAEQYSGKYFAAKQSYQKGKELYKMDF